MRELIPACGLVLAGALVVWLQPGAGSPTDRAATPAPETAAASQVAADRDAPSAGAPVTVRVPAIGVDAPVDPVSVRGSELDPPADPARVGWWAQGARPGDRYGAVVLTGHTVHGGGGVFDDLESLEPGDEISVGLARRASSYVVQEVETVSRAELAERSVELLGRRGPARLVLVTCEDWDGAAYTSSVVVTAHPR